MYSEYGEQLALNYTLRATLKTAAETVLLRLSITSIEKTHTVGDISEVADGNYSPQAISLGAPAESAGKMYVKNTADVTFGPWSADQTSDITWCFLTHTTAGGTATNTIVIQSLTAAKKPAAGETLTFPANSFEFYLEDAP